MDAQTNNLSELEEAIETMIDNPIRKGKKEKRNFLNELHDLMKRYNQLAGRKVYNLNFQP